MKLQTPLERVNLLLALLLVISWFTSIINVVRLSEVEFAGDHHSHNRGITDNQSSDVHIIFSTDCSGYQHWQSIVSYYSLRRAGHLGQVTRIVSGCTPKQEEDIKNEFRSIQTSNNNQINIHFTKSFALVGKHYKYSNKPGGMLDWITNNTTTLKESVIALVDPDMMALRPIMPQLREGLISSLNDDNDRLVEYKDDHGRIMFLRQKQLPDLPSRVTRGLAAGQHFGLGGMWAQSGLPNARKDFREFNLTKVCGEGSPCLNVAQKDKNVAFTSPTLANNVYAVGPVYIASTEDWKELLPRWHKFTPRVHEQYPKLLAEMFAFTMSAADMQLRFTLSSSYMVSDPKTMSTTEGWIWIDEYSKKASRTVCEGATSNSLPTETLKRLGNYGYGNYQYHNDLPVESAGALPNFLHYCQSYKGVHTFAKRKMQHDFFRCDGEPLEFDLDALVNELDLASNLTMIEQKKLTRTAFMLCHLIPLMNMALDDYKQDVCL